MKIFVKLVGQENLFEIECTQDESIDSIKQKVSTKTGIPVERQRLLFKGHALSSGTLESAGVEPDNTIYCLERLLTDPTSSTANQPLNNLNNQQPPHNHNHQERFRMDLQLFSHQFLSILVQKHHNKTLRL